MNEETQITMEDLKLENRVCGDMLKVSKLVMALKIIFAKNLVMIVIFLFSEN